MTKQKIFKKLKQKYISVEEMGYQVLYVSIFNWQDLESDTHQDIICNVVVAPSLNDIINNNVLGIKTFLTDDNFFISIQDIRKITEITNKTEYVIFNKQYKELLKPLYDNGTNAELFAKIKQDLIKQILKDKLVPKSETEYTLCPDHYRNVFITSDTHFGHSNILEYENRTELMNVSGVMEHDNRLIDNWNSVVKKDDLVLILGDFSFHKPIGTEDILNRLNGDKVLIVGNHDMFLENKKFDKTLFKAIYTYKETRYKGQEICLMHYPIQRFKHQDRIDKCAVLLFGHIHSRPMEIPKHSYNVGVDVNNYTPVRLEEAIEKARKNNGGQINGK